MKEDLSAYELLEFYVSIGADEAIGDDAIDRTQVTEKIITLPLPGTEAPRTAAEAPSGTIEALADAQALAASADSLDALKAALDSFKGMTLKRSAAQMVFADGNPQSGIMIVGDYPRADDERSGRPFAGDQGVLLNKMLAAIGLDREQDVYISTVVNWRPPGNRAPTGSEISLSLPFIRRHIELAQPKLIILAGGNTAKVLMQTNTTITRLRGKWVDYTSPALAAPVPMIPIFDPEYLMRTPHEKALAWKDLLQIRERLTELKLPLK
jgi:DNA polymerase